MTWGGTSLSTDWRSPYSFSFTYADHLSLTSKVERVATNALFMLISAAETSRRNSFGFGITGASAPMLAAIDRLGLGGSFSDLMKG